MGYFNDMVASLTRNIEMNEDFPGDCKFNFSQEGKLECINFMGRICPSNKPFGKSILYSFRMACDVDDTTSYIRANLYHRRNKISEEDLIIIGNELNSEFPFCPFFYDKEVGRGVVATEIFSTFAYNNDDSEDDEVFVIPHARNQLHQFYIKLSAAAETYIKDDCV